mmetsp:Transcript_2997/g.10557  ORF Transcript_2997/g.10557 Transcript_2997/m.10557 type:complete len:441 (+) Transcript_2997:220-1542(+)
MDMVDIRSVRSCRVSVSVDPNFVFLVSFMGRPSSEGRCRSCAASPSCASRCSQYSWSRVRSSTSRSRAACVSPRSSRSVSRSSVRVASSFSVASRTPRSRASSPRDESSSAFAASSPSPASRRPSSASASAARVSARSRLSLRPSSHRLCTFSCSLPLSSMARFRCRSAWPKRSLSSSTCVRSVLRPSCRSCTSFTAPSFISLFSRSLYSISRPRSYSGASFFSIDSRSASALSRAVRSRQHTLWSSCCLRRSVCICAAFAAASFHPCFALLSSLRTSLSGCRPDRSRPGTPFLRGDCLALDARSSFSFSSLRASSSSRSASPFRSAAFFSARMRLTRAEAAAASERRLSSLLRSCSLSSRTRLRSSTTTASSAAAAERTSPRYSSAGGPPAPSAAAASPCTSAFSTPSAAPASFSTTAMRRPCCCVSTWFTSVVLPAPR